MADAQLNIRITATNEASKVLEEVSKVVEEMAKTFQTASDTMSKSLESMSKAASAAGKETDIAMKEIADAAKSMSTNSTKDLESLDKKLEETAKITAETSKKTADSMAFIDAQIAGDTIKGAGESITGFFEKAISSSVDFDQAVVNTSASLNSNLPTGIRLSSREIDSMKSKALELGQSGFFSANQIGEAMNTLAKQGIDYKTIMGGAIETVSQVAAANQEDLESTSNVVSDIIHEMGDSLKSQFGEDTKAQLTAVGDAMTGALHHARISMDDYLNTMKYVGPQASAQGVGIQELSASIALLGQHGIRGSQAGTTLRRMLTNLTPQSKEATVMMKELGMITANGANIFYDAHGKMKPLAEVQELIHSKLAKLNPEMQQMAIKTIFGQYALSGMTAIADTAPEKFQELTTAMAKQGITAELVADKSRGWGIEVQALRSHIETFLKDIGERFKPVMEGVMQAIDGAINMWKGLPGPVQNAVIAITAVIGVVLTVGGAFLGLMATIGMVMTSWTAISAVIGVAIGPFMSVVAVIAVVVAALAALSYAWSNNLGGIRDKSHEIWNSIKESTETMWNNLKLFLTNLWNGIKDLARTAWGYMYDDINGALTKISDFWNSNWENIKTVFDVIWKTILAILTPAILAVTVAISDALGFIKGAWSDAWNAIKDVFKLGWDLIVDIIRLGWDTVTGIFQLALDLLTGHWSDAWSTMKSLLSNVWNDIVTLFQNFKNNANNFGVDFVKSLANGIMAGIGYVISAATAVVDRIKSIFSSAPKSPDVSGGGDSVPQFAEGGVVEKPTLALVGEGGEREYIIPESKLKGGGMFGDLSTGTMPLPANIPFGGGFSRNTGGTVQIAKLEINVNGVGKDGKQIGTDISDVLRRQFSFAL